MLRWAISALMICIGKAQAQTQISPGPLVLQAATLPFTPEQYYIAELVDERKDRKAVAWLLPESPAQATVAQAIDLHGGGAFAIGQFIRQSLPRNAQLRPIIIRLKECQVQETAGEKGRVDGRITVTLSFDLLRGEEKVHLTHYRGGARYNRPSSQVQAVEPALRNSLADGLIFFNNWMKREYNRNEKMARGIRVHFDDHTQNADDDTLFYNPLRPLSWDDFRAQLIRPSKYAASVFPSFSYEGRSEVVNGIIQVHLTTKTFVLRNSSWVKGGARDAYGLNHEQRHFDIVKLVVERFKAKIQSENLSLKTYNSDIQYEYIESFREMNQLQEQYDGETNHGLDHAAQERWNRRLDEELHRFGVKGLRD
jgi:hypothetical protein